MIGIRRAFAGLEFRTECGFLFQYNTLSDWGQRAKRLDRSLGAYTPAPSTSSSMRALVQHLWLVAESRGLDWPLIFGRGFWLRCFQPLSSAAWLPGGALSDNR